MGTRADFYVGRGEKAVWLGSVAFDGYPEGVLPAVFKATTEDEFRRACADYFSSKPHATLPEMGWPWPWDDSRTTDFAYAFDDGKVWASCFGREWFEPPSADRNSDGPRDAVFPDMKAIKKVTLGERSGLIVMTSKGPLPTKSP